MLLFFITNQHGLQQKCFTKRELSAQAGYQCFVVMDWGINFAAQGGDCRSRCRRWSSPVQCEMYRWALRAEPNVSKGLFDVNNYPTIRYILGI
jgi:hypothetical protein